jgi:PPM family protein phosphatase
MTTFQCSECGVVLQVGDNFCEVCGTAQASFSQSDFSVINNKIGCEKCGALITEIDADGFCNQCGFRQENRVNDRFEVVCSTKLAAVCDRGLRHHHNEDFTACAEVDGNTYVMVVCDGVSSSESPELASKAAAGEVCRFLQDGGKGELTRSALAELSAGIASASAKVSAIPYAITKSGEAPSTTVVAAFVVDRVATIGWLGDSRAYWISRKGSRLLTKDDSWFNEVVLSGEMTEAEARISANAHAITRWLGADAIDFEPSIIEFLIPDSGYLLLCSDGLWNYAEDIIKMENLVINLVNQNSGSDAVTVARGLVEFARRKGGYDNITVAILDFGF